MKFSESCCCDCDNLVKLVRAKTKKSLFKIVCAILGECENFGDVYFFYKELCF